ncbi:MAG: UDP-N-acetylmuramoyl-L-alanyl-D-glutamate--2,6-diaminopimelate ligase [Candidatus Wildermuthbacteria bacterium]|nr:UDP-N-acetylmuramoyl-L-alanyl-D-glutamate--2,6-diaminopimelate ligase [Candidatus Wildermuthbacteria bacterium]
MQTLVALLRRVAPSWAVGAYHYAQAWSAALWFGFPSRRLCVIGVTGTDGKSTTVEMIAHILNAAGMKTAISSSIHIGVGEAVRKNTMKMSMSGPFALQRLLREAVSAQCSHAVLEVSSEGVIQHRHVCIEFHAAVLTNIYPEHIERHGSFEAYRKAKMRFVRRARAVHVLNAEDKNLEFFVHLPAERTYLFSTDAAHSAGGHETIIVERIEETPEGISFSVRGVPFRLPLLGRVNAYNAASALCVALSQGVPLETASAALKTIARVPGRMEAVVNNPFTVLVDYAVTPNALQNLYETAKRIWKPNRMVCVFGACGGGRDAWKRPVLGEIAGRHCDAIILTNEDPFDEHPARIVSEIRGGIDREREVWEVLDRREAIQKAYSLAGRGDLVVLSGKGSEDSITLARGEKIPWNEVEIAQELFRSHSSMDRAQPSEG